jgi:hypothetical protein
MYGRSIHTVKASMAKGPPENDSPDNDIEETYLNAKDVLSDMMHFKVPEGNELGHASSMVTPFVQSGVAGFHSNALGVYGKPRSNSGDQ